MHGAAFESLGQKMCGRRDESAKKAATSRRNERDAGKARKMAGSSSTSTAFGRVEQGDAVQQVSLNAGAALSSSKQSVGMVCLRVSVPPVRYSRLTAPMLCTHPGGISPTTICLIAGALGLPFSTAALLIQLTAFFLYTDLGIVPLYHHSHLSNPLLQWLLNISRSQSSEPAQSACPSPPSTS
jgi:hypothetical protein